MLCSSYNQITTTTVITIPLLLVRTSVVYILFSERLSVKVKQIHEYEV